MNKLVSSISKLQYLLFPCRCAVCNKVIYLGREFCDDCIYELRPIPESIATLLVSNPKINMRLGLVPVYKGVAAPYYHDDGSKKMIYNLKFHGRKDLAEFIGNKMYITYKEYLEKREIDYICTVPSNRGNTVKRGYNHIKLLANKVSKLSGKPNLPILRLIRKKKAQHNLKTAAERLNNLKGAFGFNNKFNVKGKNILLIDDIMTTGATVNECAKVLKKKGAKNVYALMATINL